MPDILSQIIKKRKTDIQKFGVNFGIDIPQKRLRPEVPFLQIPGTILEIKRASPSKGDIAPSLDIIQTAKAYQEAGTQAISVLTEPHFFKGSLQDLIQASNAVSQCSFLRKDFILEEAEIEISYLCGADAVLLIARILETPLLLKMAERCREFNMVPFIEIRSAADLEKLQLAAKEGDVVGGVNARDLANFCIDPLVPALHRDSMPCKAVFESGVSTPKMAAFARNLGFEGILIGEAAAKNPQSAKHFVTGFTKTAPNRNGMFWKRISQKREALKKEVVSRPLIKICGITCEEDALQAYHLGADILGFVFAKSPRKASVELVKALRTTFLTYKNSPLLVGVITDPLSFEGKQAIELAQEGFLDAIQFHGINLPGSDQDNNFGNYITLPIGSETDILELKNLIQSGEVRVMIDFKSKHCQGGSGNSISDELIEKSSKEAPLWLAGGISTENVCSIIQKWNPELIDVSSKLEIFPGKKDPEKMKLFFEQISHRSFT